MATFPGKWRLGKYSHPMEHLGKITGGPWMCLGKVRTFPTSRLPSPAEPGTLGAHLAEPQRLDTLKLSEAEISGDGNLDVSWSLKNEDTHIRTYTHLILRYVASIHIYIDMIYYTVKIQYTHNRT